jgi:hypothetical protein
MYVESSHTVVDAQTFLLFVLSKNTQIRTSHKYRVVWSNHGCVLQSPNF